MSPHHVLLLELYSCNGNLDRAPLSAVLENPRALPNRDSGTGPAQARCAIGCHCKIKILDASEMLKDVLAVIVPHVDSMRESLSVLALQHLLPTLERGGLSALARRDHNATPRRQSHRGQSHRAVGVNVVSPLSLSLRPWEPFLRRAC